MDALKLAPQDSVLLQRISSLYFGAGDDNAGLAFGRRAYEAAPSAKRGSFDAFLEVLKQQATQPETQSIQ